MVGLFLEMRCCTKGGGRGVRQLPNLHLHLLIPLLVVVMAGCTGAYGRIQADASVTTMFQQGNLPDDHKYYAIGRSGQPWAVIGIAPSYTLLSTIWRPVPNDSEDLATMIRQTWTDPSLNLNSPPRGGVIASPEGTRIGLWYSSFAFTNVKMEGDNGVYVFSPYQPGPLEGGGIYIRSGDAVITGGAGVSTGGSP